ncbi:hypothetical protein RRG08_019514, partial [Elysia crispata]
VSFDKGQLGDVQDEVMDSWDYFLIVLVSICGAIVMGVVVFLVNGVFLTDNEIFGRRNLRPIISIVTVRHFRNDKLAPTLTWVYSKSSEEKSQASNP